MDKVVLFGWGGVMIDQNNKTNSFDTVNTRLIDWAEPKDRVAMRKMFFDSRMYTLQGKELMAFIEDRLSAAGSKRTAQEFCNQYAVEEAEIPYFNEVEGLIKLTGNHAKIGVFSTMSRLSNSRFLKEYTDIPFDYWFLSYALGADKESGKLFDVASSIIGVHRKAVKILLLDDSSENVERANSLANWEGIRVDGGDYDRILSFICEFLGISTEEFFVKDSR